MNRDDVVRLAFEATNGRNDSRLVGCAIDDLMRFAELIEQALELPKGE